MELLEQLEFGAEPGTGRAGLNAKEHQLLQPGSSRRDRLTG